MTLRFSWVLPALLVVAMDQGIAAADIPVDARCNIFGAGHTTPPPADSGGVGILPAAYAFTPGPGQQIVFTDVEGLVGCCATLNFDLANGPDGGVNGSGTTDITSVGGISGIVDGQHTMFLVGVFTDGSEPADPAPRRLDFSAEVTREDFRELSPELNQTFFIGDGRQLTGIGSLQAFDIPPTATTLWLGFADAYQFGDPSGPPGSYDDNLGMLNVSLQVVDASVAGVNDSHDGFQMQPTLGDPRRGGCKVRFTLPAAQPVRLTVYDVGGRRVRDLASGEMMRAGANEVVWDGRDAQGTRVRAGVYFANLRCAAGTGTARVFATP